MSVVTDPRQHDRGAGEPSAADGGALASAGRVHLLCELGRHRPAPGARQSQGYCFTSCERCGCDLVRRDEGHWFVPRGYRVGWHREPPEGAKPVSILEDLEPARAPLAPQLLGVVRGASGYLGLRRQPEGQELPIREVLRNLNESEREQQDAQRLTAPTPSSVLDDDFMRDDSESPWGEEAAFTTAPLPAREPDTEPDDQPVPPPADDPAASSPVDKEPEVAPAQVPDSEPAEVASSDLEDDFSNEARPGLFSRLAARLPAVGAIRIPWASILIGAVTVFSLAAFVLILSFVTRREQPVPSPEPNRVAEPANIPRAVPKFVAARIVQCRSAPARQAASVRRLGRGTRVDMLALDGEWASVSHRGRQCWVAARYLSTERPL